MFTARQKTVRALRNSLLIFHCKTQGFIWDRLRNHCSLIFQPRKGIAPPKLLIYVLLFVPCFVFFLGTANAHGP